ncbi:MAG: D-sedoheptulose 7-phosphate isomerase [Lentimicrobiaceae bacterium]|jgi:D-sedoheptulose 7-phosphate isomerase
MKSKIKSVIQSSIDLKTKVLNDTVLIETLQKVVEQIIHCYENGGKVLLCGNGGSAADAQHIAAELSGRFYFDRHPLYAEALHTNSSYVTAVANDYGYDEIFARLVLAMGSKNDILIGLSTSGNSPNILRAFTEANSLEMKTIGFTGETGGELKDKCTFLLNVPSADTPRIQEVHILLGHIICELVEKKLFKD